MDHRAQRRRPPGLVSVILPVRDGAATIGAQLAALAAQSYVGQSEVIVADNGSSDGTASIVRQWAERIPGLRLVDASERPGSSFARNRGAQAAAGELLAFCDADDVVTVDWLARLVDAATQHDLVSGTQDDRALNSPAVRRWRPPRPRDGLPPDWGFYSFAPSCNLAVWADVYGALGGFAERYAQAHDVDFSFRAQLAGHDLGFAPNAVVHYRYRSDIAGVWRQALRSGEEAALLYREYRHHRPPLWRALRTWMWLAARAPLLLDRERRGLWVRRAGEALGRLRGSLRFHVLYP